MRKNEYTTLEKTLITILQNLTEQSDEDCPQEYRSRHFKDALEDAKDTLHRNPNPNPNYGCQSCNVIMINGTRCHETGCPESTQP